MNDRIPHTESDLVLVDVKAQPSGWPPASLDRGCGRRRHQHRSGSKPNITNPPQTWLEHSTDGQQREGPDRRFDCEPRGRPPQLDAAVTLDLRHAEAPQPNAVLR